MRQIEMLLQAARRIREPKSLEDRAVVDRLREERTHFDALANNPDSTVYGLNTLSGHRDNERVRVAAEQDLQIRMLRSHQIPPLDHATYDDFAVRCIGWAKAIAVARGGTGMTPTLYRHLLETLADPAFRPAIPAGQSYSSGDVIPAAHWAAAMLQHNRYLARHDIAPGEGMALINGAFVHLGLAAANLPALRACAEQCARAMAALAMLCGARRETFERYLPPDAAPAAPLLDHIVGQVSAGQPDAAPDVQVSVSVRGIPETLLALASTTMFLAQQLEWALEQPSGNPLYDATADCMRSQGSFLAMSVTMAQSAVIEALLAAGWALVAQVQYLLSGRVKDVPVDGAAPGEFGLIQVPKAMMATLESLRATHGRRGFASGATTSNGIEDLWTGGEHISRQVTDAAGTVSNLALRARAICELLHEGDAFRTRPSGNRPTLQPSATLERLATIETRLHGEDPALGFLPWTGE